MSLYRPWLPYVLVTARSKIWVFSARCAVGKVNWIFEWASELTGYFCTLLACPSATTLCWCCMAHCAINNRAIFVDSFLTCECHSGTRNIAVRAVFILQYTTVRAKCWCINGLFRHLSCSILQFSVTYVGNVGA